MKNYEKKKGDTSTPWFSLKDQITDVLISDKICSIGNRSFYGFSQLHSITIPKHIKEIGDRALVNCPALSTITVNDANKYFKSVNNVLFTKDGTKLVQYASAKSESSYSVPTEVTTILSSAFSYNSHLETITLPDGIKMIDDGTFNRCASLASVNIPATVRTIGQAAFQLCSSLSSITIPNSVSVIEDYAFNKCTSLTSIVIPNSVTKIGNSAFSNCSLSTVSAPKLFEPQFDQIFGKCAEPHSINWTE